MLTARFAEHHFAPRLRDHKVRIVNVAAHLGRPVSSVSSWLRGIAPMPSEIEAQLDSLLNELDTRHPRLPIVREREAGHHA